GGECFTDFLPSSWRRAGRDSVADRWSCGACNLPTPALRATPPRARRGVLHGFCPPRLGGQAATVSRPGGPCLASTLATPVLRATPARARRGVLRVFALHVEESRTRQCRGQVVLRRFEPTTPSLRATPPRRGGECV